jgi:hypothetical protein
LRDKPDKTGRLNLVPPVIAFAVFLIYLFQIRDEPFVRHLVANPLVYESQAQRILEGLPRARPFFLSPLYPAFMALVDALTHGSRLLLLGAQGILLAVNVGLLGAASSRLLSRKVALAAMTAMAFYWSFHYFAGEVLPTTLCLTFMLAGIRLFVEKDSEGLHRSAIPVLAFAGIIVLFYGLPGLRNLGSLLRGISLPVALSAYWGSLSLPLIIVPGCVASLIVVGRVRKLRGQMNLLASGIVLGISILVWSGISIVAALLALNLLGGRGRRVIRAGVFVLGIGIPVAAGLSHNYLVSGDIVPVTTSFGVNLFIGNNSAGDGMNPFNLGEGDEARIEADKRGLSGTARSSYFRERAISFMSREPERWLRLVGRKALMSVSRFPIDNNADISERREAWGRLFLPRLHFGIVFPLAMAGLIYALGSNRRTWPLVLGFAGCLFINVLFFVAERFRAPATVFLFPLAASGMFGLCGDVMKRRWHRLLFGVVILASAAALSNPDYMALSDVQFPSIIVNKAHVERLSGDFTAARALITEALRREPENAGAYFQLGAMEQYEGNEAPALTHYLESLERDPFFYASYSRAQIILENAHINTSYLDSYIAAVIEGRDRGDLRKMLIRLVRERLG